MNTYKFNTMSGTFFIDAKNLFDAVAKAKQLYPNTTIKQQYIKLVKSI